MKTAKPSLWTRLRERLLPRMPDFYGLMAEQAACSDDGIAALCSFMEDANATSAQRVRTIEHSGDIKKLEALSALHRSFATPIDREDIFAAISRLDAIISYAKTTVREMEILHLPPDEHTRALAAMLVSGSKALRSGFTKLQHNPQAADADAETARKIANHARKIYYQALADLFDPSHYVETQTSAQRKDAKSVMPLLSAFDPQPDHAVATGIAFVLEVLKRREIYHHLTDAAVAISEAGDTLHNIIVKSE